MKFDDKILAAIVGVLVLIAVVLGFFMGSSVGYYTYSNVTSVTYACPNGTTNYTCSNGLLTCYICSTNYNTKNYNVTLSTVAYQNTTNGTVLAGIFTVNTETFSLRAGQTRMLTDMTIFGVTTLVLNYSAFYLQSTYETKSSSLTVPFPKSTTVALTVSIGGGCGAGTYSCPSGYTPSCSGSTLICNAKKLCLGWMRSYCPAMYANATNAIECRGDASGDCRIDGMDLTMFARAWGTYSGNPNYNFRVDFDCNGRIDAIDLSAFARNWGKSC